MITLKNEITNDVKTVKQGFSWTVLFFGALVPLFRGDWLWFLLMLLATSLTYGISLMVFPFVYNSIYINKLYDKGYKRVWVIR